MQTQKYSIQQPLIESLLAWVKEGEMAVLDAQHLRIPVAAGASEVDIREQFTSRRVFRPRDPAHVEATPQPRAGMNSPIPRPTGYRG